MELAALSGFSLAHFHRVFRGMTGETVMGYARRLRLERAAMRLRFADVPITEVALAVGYASHEAFTRAFRSHFAMSPRQYRDQWPTVRASRTPVVLRDEPDRTCVALRHRGAYERCDDAWVALMAWARGHGVYQRSIGSFGLVHDDVDITPTDKLRYDACLTLPESDLPESLPPEARIQRVPGGRYAVAVHHGRYETLGETYVELLGRWMPQRGVELSDSFVLEVYLNLPDETPADALRTEVCVRIDAPQL